MCWLVIAVSVLLITGPLRRPFFSNWTFTVPAVVWGLLAWKMIPEGPPFDIAWWAPYAFCVLVAVGAGISGKRWLDGIFGGKR